MEGCDLGVVDGGGDYVSMMIGEENVAFGTIIILVRSFVSFLRNETESAIRSLCSFSCMILQINNKASHSIFRF